MILWQVLEVWGATCSRISEWIYGSFCWTVHRKNWHTWKVSVALNFRVFLWVMTGEEGRPFFLHKLCNSVNLSQQSCQISKAQQQIVTILLDGFEVNSRAALHVQDDVIKNNNKIYKSSFCSMILAGETETVPRSNSVYPSLSRWEERRRRRWGDPGEMDDGSGVVRLEGSKVKGSCGSESHSDVLLSLSWLSISDHFSSSSFPSVLFLLFYDTEKKIVDLGFFYLYMVIKKHQIIMRWQFDTI